MESHAVAVSIDMNMGHQCFARAPVPPTYSAARRYEYMQERPPCLTAVGLDQPGTDKMAWRCRPHEPETKIVCVVRLHRLRLIAKRRVEGRGEVLISVL